MRHHTNTVAGAMFLGLVASGSAFAAPDAAAPAATAAATECLAAPKSETPPGGHWYYRTDRSTKRKCWYVGDASAKTSKVATAKPSRPAAPKPEAAAREKDTAPSFDNARAEMESANAAPDDAKLQDSVWPPMPDKAAADAPQANTQDSAITPPQTAQPAPSQDAAAQQQPLATNWLTQPPATNSPELKSSLSASETTATETDAASPATSQPAADPQPAVAAAAPPAPAPTSSMPMLLAALACALGLAAIIGSIVVKLFDRRRDRKARADDRIQRRDIRSRTPVDEMQQPYPALSTPANLDDIARAASDGGDPDHEIKQLLAKASRRRAA
jgi:hypothetical protein